MTHALAVEAGRSDLEARALGLEGNVRARMGDATSGLPLVRRGLGMALDLGLTTAAAELYQRLADSLEHAGTYDPARAAYLEGAEYCRTRSIEPTAQLCLACMAVVLWQTGDWPGAERTSREVVTSSDATPHATAVAEGIVGMVAAMRGNAIRARPHLERSLQLARRIELAAMEIISSWGLAVCERLDGDQSAALERCSDILARWERTEECHYVVQPLRWATSVFAEAGDATDVRACADALAKIAAQTGQPEAVAALANALGEAASLEGDQVAAVAHLMSALETVSTRDLPLERAAIGRQAGLALARAGRRADAVSVLVARGSNGAASWRDPTCDVDRGRPRGDGRVGRAAHRTSRGPAPGGSWPDPARAGDRSSRGPRADEPRDRGGIVHQPAHGRDARRQRTLEAGLSNARRSGPARGHARLAVDRVGLREAPPHRIHSSPAKGVSSAPVLSDVPHPGDGTRFRDLDAFRCFRPASGFHL